MNTAPSLLLVFIKCWSALAQFGFVIAFALLILLTNVVMGSCLTNLFVVLQNICLSAGSGLTAGIEKFQHLVLDRLSSVLFQVSVT